MSGPKALPHVVFGAPSWAIGWRSAVTALQ